MATLRQWIKQHPDEFVYIGSNNMGVGGFFYVGEADEDAINETMAARQLSLDRVIANTKRQLSLIESGRTEKNLKNRIAEFSRRIDHMGIVLSMPTTRPKDYYLLNKRIRDASAKVNYSRKSLSDLPRQLESLKRSEAKYTDYRNDKRLPVDANIITEYERRVVKPLGTILLVDYYHPHHYWTHQEFLEGDNDE